MTIKRYILNKYHGFIKVETERLTDELLLTRSEFLILKRKVKKNFSFSKIPTYLALNDFADIVSDEILGIES